MKNGFTIIELIISIFILSVAVVGIFSAFSIMTILTSDTADRLVATYLAQEGMEIIRNIRDTNWLNMDAGGSNDTWVDGLDNCTTGCEADYTTTAPDETGFISIPVRPYVAGDYLYVNTNGFYGYLDLVTKTKFERKIIITPIADVNNQLDDHIIKVTAQVSWDKKATILNSSGFSADSCMEGKNCIIAEETLYDWYNYVNR